jgi:hypothetical protein
VRRPDEHLRRIVREQEEARDDGERPRVGFAHDESLERPEAEREHHEIEGDAPGIGGVRMHGAQTGSEPQRTGECPRREHVQRTALPAGPIAILAEQTRRIFRECEERRRVRVQEVAQVRRRTDHLRTPATVHGR